MDNHKLPNLRTHVLQKIEKALNDISYRDAIENSSKYNNRLVDDRKTRLPFIDSQTGVAQRDCKLWMKKWQRMPGSTYGQLYTYPAYKWRKKRRGYLLHENYFSRNQVNVSSEAQNNTNINTNNNIGQNGQETAPFKMETSENSSDKFIENSKDAWMYAEYEDSIDLLEGDFDDPESDGDDYDEYTIRRKRRRSRRKKSDQPENDKPYACDLCDARYKTRPGLTYHYSHNHQNDGDKRSKSSTPVSLVDEDELTSRSSTRNNNTTSIGSNSNQSNNNSSAIADQCTISESSKPLAAPNPYCDFCLGDDKSKIREKMVSCSDCGRSAHPTCLQFTPQMIISVQKYRWQCIECKSCGVCGTSDNDEQLLFCDDCDRGYHMYCLTPPISEPPEGSWSCHLCIGEYHALKDKKDSMVKEGENDINGKLSGTNEEKKCADIKSNSGEKTNDEHKNDKHSFPDDIKSSEVAKISDKEKKNEIDDKKIEEKDPIEEKLETIFNQSKKE